MAFTSAVRNLKVSLIQTREDLLQLQQSLDMTAMGKLSTTLVPPHNLSEILMQIVRELPEGVSMLMKPTIENMYVYYQVADVHACAVPAGIRLFIDIPLKGNDRYFEVFRPYSLPYYDHEIKEFVSIRVPKGILLTVSENKQLFTLMTQDDLNQCKEGFFTICPADLVLMDRTAQHCLIALYLGNDEIVRKTCKER